MQAEKFFLEDEAATKQIAEQLYKVIRAGRLDGNNLQLITLKGDLGAGKTTFVRAFIQASGFEGTVKSPTWSLMEPYELENFPVTHMDLYRLSDPEELIYLGLEDELARHSLLLVEWPEMGEGYLPDEDIEIKLEHLSSGRNLILTAKSESGRMIIEQVA